MAEGSSNLGYGAEMIAEEGEEEGGGSGMRARAGTGYGGTGVPIFDTHSNFDHSNLL